MKLLLDTHTFLWFVESNPKLGAAASALIEDRANDLHLSMASIWEIAIKVGLKKLTLTVSLRDLLATSLGANDITLLPITMDDCCEYEALSFPDPNHRDPFDRMIVVHARSHQLRLVGCDIAFDAYGIARSW